MNHNNNLKLSQDHYRGNSKNWDEKKNSYKVNPRKSYLIVKGQLKYKTKEIPTLKYGQRATNILVQLLEANNFVKITFYL